MVSKKILGSCCLISATILGVVLAYIFEALPNAGIPTTAIAQVPIHNIPADFDWKSYIQNYEDLRRAGIDTEEKAKRHWVEWGKDEGRDYHVLPSAKSTSVTLDEAAKPAVTLESESATPHFDPVRFREWYNQLLERAGVKTKKEAMDFSLAFWEKKRKDYFA